MADRTDPIQIRMQYCFDRLSAQKVSQVYRLLVSEKIKGLKEDVIEVGIRGDMQGEDSGHLDPSLLRQAEGIRNH